MATNGVIAAEQQQPVQVIAEEQVPPAAGPRPRARGYSFGQQLPLPRTRLAISFAWNEVHIPVGTLFRGPVRQVYACMTHSDYEKLLAVAFLLCLTLIRPNFLLVIAAGLISPLFGPVMTSIVGSINGDREFCWMGLKNALIGIAISAIMGLAVGLVLYGIGHLGLNADLTAEGILYQCNYLSMFVRYNIAILIGAVSILFFMDLSLFYFARWAISSSLLLPAVRAGVQLGLGLATQMLQPGRHMCGNLFKSYKPQFSDHMETELMMSSLASVVQVAGNLFCITVTGTFLLRWTVHNKRIPVLRNRR
ncbi:Hypothetical predicted protein [Drosophila guanche]|uniref:Uncharacterized protein n=1 Tax=Drosophila guanche TaxID=7266 RepID=A0A3B0K8E0_DROGU|nr:Hypothetical predicted protein [Drosophila guanche]